MYPSQYTYKTKFTTRNPEVCYLCYISGRKIVKKIIEHTHIVKRIKEYYSTI